MALLEVIQLRHKKEDPMKRRYTILLSLALGLASTAGNGRLMADNPTASISGNVTDPSGSVIPNAQVTVRNVETGVERRTVTNEVGAYRVAGLQIGQYEMDISYSGFQPWKRSRLLLRVGDERRVDAVLTLRGSNTIEVTEE